MTKVIANIYLSIYLSIYHQYIINISNISAIYLSICQIYLACMCITNISWYLIDISETQVSIWMISSEPYALNWSLGVRYFGDYGEYAMRYTVPYVEPTFKCTCTSFVAFILRIQNFPTYSSKIRHNHAERILAAKY